LTADEPLWRLAEGRDQRYVKKTGINPGRAAKGSGAGQSARELTVA
jgi:hypothetical protein